MNSLRYRHVIWDWNGTLLNDAALCVEAVNPLLSKRGLRKLSVTDYRASFNFPVENYYRELGFDLERESFADLSEEFFKNYRAGWARFGLRDGVLDLVRRLAAAGVRQSVVSAAEENSLRGQLDEHDLLGELDDVVGRDDVLAHGKGDLALRWADQEEITDDPEGRVLVGDTLHDHEVADSLGVDCLLVDGGHQSAERLATTGAPVLDGLPEVADRLSG